MQEADAEQNMVNPETQAPLTSCPKSYTPTDIALLQQLGERRKQLEERDNALATKENLLGAASKKVEDKIADLKTLQSKVEDLLVKFGEQEDKKLNSLVKIYENMKPKDAATIFNALEMDVLLMLISKMKELKTAPILAYMDPKRAEAVTVELANQRKTIAPQDGCMVE